MEEFQAVALAEAGKWAEKLAGMAALKESEPNAQVAINRPVSFVQACQLSNLIDAVIREMSDPEKMMDLLTTTNESTFSTKPLTDLVRPAKAVQGMKPFRIRRRRSGC